MSQESILANRVGGTVAVIIGLGAISEAVRLYPLSPSPLAGDHTMIGFTGLGLLVIGLFFILSSQTPRFKVDYPSGKLRYLILAVVGALFMYRYLIPVLGYLISTFITLFILLKIMGQFHWLHSLLGGAIFTFVVYLIFVLWLGYSFPAGIIGI